MDRKKFQNRILQERTNLQAILPPHTTHHRIQPMSLFERNIKLNMMPFRPARDNIHRSSSLNRVDNSGMLSIRSNSINGKPLYSANEPTEDMAQDGDFGESLELETVPHVYDERVERLQEASICVPEYVDNKVITASHLAQFASNSEGSMRRRTRSARYLEAEQALTRLSQCCLQDVDSSNTLKIDALTRATSILAAHAVDAREGAEKLRLLLADRETEPTLFNSMQRQRWMAERRLLATEEILKTARQHLSTLTSSPSLPPTSSALPSRITSNHNAKSRANQNLAIFFDSSRRRFPARNRARRRVVATPPCPQKLKFEFPRIHHHKQLLPLRLKVPDLRPIPQTPTKKLSIVTQPLPAEHPHKSRGSSPPTSLPSSAIPLNPSPQLETVSEQPEVIDAFPFTPASPNNSDGIAVIWRATTQRSTADILAGLVVAMPDYVSELLAEFDASSSVNLPLDGLQAPSTSSNTPSILPPSLAMPSASSPLLHKSPSRRRISGLFSLPDALTSRRGLGIPAQSRLSKSSSTPPALVTETILEDPEDPSSRLGPNPVAVSFSGLVSAVTLNSANHDHGDVDAILEACSDPERPEPVHAPMVDEKVLTRLRRRMSALRRH